jgi:hypothetical protein
MRPTGASWGQERGAGNPAVDRLSRQLFGEKGSIPIV